MLQQHTMQSPIGRLILLADGGKLTHILFEDQELADIGVSPEDVVDGASNPVLAAAATQLDEYFQGSRTEFDVPLHLGGTEFQRRAWLALADIPYGQTTTYGAQAAAIGNPNAFRAVGAANGQNPIPVILPCHRIIGSDGSLTGFGGGIEVKRWLLDHEQAQGMLPFA